MTSEHLSRGKRLDNGEWVEGCYAKTITGQAYILPESSYISFEYQTIAIGGFVEVDSSTVGRCAGLTDKNGKKIFEGDKCRVTRPCVLAYGEITFANGCFWFVDDGPGGMLRLCDIKPNGFEIEVIGNINDNPELMERQEVINEKSDL